MIFRLQDRNLRFVLITIAALSIFICAGSTGWTQQDSAGYVKKGWAASGKGDFEQVYRLADKCIDKFSQEAQALASELSDFPPQAEVSRYQVMNDVATCYFIKGEALRNAGKTEEAKKVLGEAIEKYPYAQAYDPRGWYWSVAEKSNIVIAEIEGIVYEPPHRIEKEIKISLHDEGEEFPVDYSRYGKFKNVGTKDYKYQMNDPIGLGRATGEGIYPNSSSVRFDPEFVKIKKQLHKIDHWKILNSRDLKTAFYKWNLAPESPGTKLFYIAELLERSGLIKHAVKAYHAILVHFPKTYAWTYWHTPWYVGKAALYRLKTILKQNPQLGVKLEDASIIVLNGNDNDVRNDEFIVNPGRLARLSLSEKLFWTQTVCGTKERKPKNMVEKRGGEKISLLKYENGDWQLLVDGQPFMIKGITYGPTRVGESPDDGSLMNWSTQDVNKNGLIDGPYETWVDKNQNNQKDPDEKVMGDFALMKEMGTNCIRLYHQPFKLNKELLNQMYDDYGIFVVLGDFLGKYAIGSGADWEEGTDYDNPVHQQNMLESVKNMVMEFKDEPYVLMWLLGNENIYGLGCNADKKPESFFAFANKAALLIKSLDPQRRPIAIASGDSLYLNVFAQHCPEIDIFGTNSYRGKYGFLDLWDEVRRVAGVAAMITEFGAPAYAAGYEMEEAQDFQNQYHKTAWNDISCNSAGFGAGNAVGGFVFEWLDEWWKAYKPAHHDRKGLFAGPFLDGYMHEEWLGLCAQGDGKQSPFMRQLRKAYFTYKELWSKK
ncbi:MAG: hypothetical protein JSW17_00700 [Candidatus Omnitrophota bacterium]|nr:MAG: hypothetical protein JSW17_00700 [Candidatus Omnitrophota bacterium]